MSRRDRLAQFRKAAPAVLPSLLLCDFGNLERELVRLEAAGVQALHLDVMDGVFVPNFTYGMTIVEAIRKLTDLPLDVHLMMVEPQRHLAAFASAGADVLTVHVEALRESTDKNSGETPDETRCEARAVLEQIRELGVGAGIALNPRTPLTALDACWDVCDLVLVMSVSAGFGGQEFQAVALDKLRAARQRGGSELLLEVDGGINRNTIRDCALAGADFFVVGSAIFRNGEYGPAVAGLSSLAQVHPA